MPARRTLASLLAAAAVGLAALALPGTTTAYGALPVPPPVRFAGTAYTQNPTNPLAGRTWAVNNGFWDDTHNHGPLWAWQHATGADRTYLGRIAGQPTALWFTARNADPARRPTVVRDYIARLQRGDADSVVPLALFGIFSVQGGEKYKTSALTAAQIATYRRWIRGISGQIGDARVAIAMEPDQALLFNRPGKPRAQWTGGVVARRALVAWATKYLHDHNPRAAVYLDAGDADWLTPAQASYLLVHTGAAYARGFMLGATHYSSTADDIAHGAAIVAALAAKGVADAHFVIDTADNGRPFTMDQFYAAHPRATGGFFDDSWPCRSATDTVCNALGIRPTWRVAKAGLGLTWASRKIAREYVDAYLWVGRPWLTDQAAPFDRAKAIRAARYSPFAS